MELMISTFTLAIAAAISIIIAQAIDKVSVNYYKYDHRNYYWSYSLFKPTNS